MSTIPVLIIPHLNRPDLLEAMLRSIDVTVDRLVIVDNARTDKDSALRAEEALGELPGLRPHVIDPGWNLGVPASINLGVKTTPDAAWWMVSNNDITYAPGALARLCDLMDRTTWPTVGMLVEWGAFAMNPGVIERAGWWDESYHPIYCEDPDFAHRCGIAGVAMVRIPSATQHAGSACYVGNAERTRDNERTYPGNVAYHRAKWGGPPWQERYRTPFDAGGDVRDWRLDLARLRDQAWR